MDNVFMDYYSDINENSLCRICLERNQHNEKMLNIFKSTQIPSMIMSCASVQITEGDGLPATICQKCMNDLDNAWQFKMQCETSDAKLRQFYSNSNNLQDSTADLYLMKSVENTESFVITNFHEDNDQNATRTADISDENSTDISNASLEPNRNSCDDLESNSNKIKDRPEISSNGQKQHQCDTCGKTFTRREYLTQHIRIHTGEKPYLCHLCEKRFVNSGHLTTHMRTHTGERPHTCNMCPKAFSTKQELQKHTMVHNGERPFVCKLCGKRFGSSSNLYSHLKHHTGEKNFNCEQCGKSFFTKQELKQHLVVHTGEKAFLCEFCNKRFSQIAHLRRHSKLHK